MVIDTNVVVVADHRTPQADDVCVAACVTVIREVRSQGVLVLDESRHILVEYGRNLQQGSGQPGVGTEFVRWLFQNLYDPKFCELVTITPRNGTGEDYVEFPSAPELEGFDRADRKFVAVARASTRSPTILNATDRDWLDFAEALGLHGVKVDHICPHLVQSRA